MEVIDSTGDFFRLIEISTPGMASNQRGISEMEISIEKQAHAGIKVVNARLNYLAEATPKPVNSAYDPPANKQAETLELNIILSIAAEQTPPSAARVVRTKPGIWSSIWRTLEAMSG